MYAYVWRYEYDDRLKSNPLRDLCFQKLLKLNLYLSTVFIIKPEVARTMTMTQCLSSRDPTEKSSISHFYVSVSSSEDVDVRYGGNLHWVFIMALALRPGAKCLGDVCECSDEGLHLPWLSVSSSSHELVFLTITAIRPGYHGWHPPHFQPPRYPINGDFDSDTRLILAVSLDSNPSEPSYPSYHVETEPSEPSHPSVIRLTSNSSSSSAASRRVPPPFVAMH